LLFLGHPAKLSRFSYRVASTQSIFCSSLKGIVSRYLHIGFWYHLIDLTFLPLADLFVCFLNFVSLSNILFSRFGIASVLWVELGLAFRNFCLSCGSHYLRGSSKCCFGGKLVKMETVLLLGFCSPALELLLLSGALMNFLCNNYIKNILPLSPRLHGTKSHIYSQGKLTALRCENRKIRHENKIFDAANHVLYVYRNFRSIEWHQKTYHKILCDYPFKLKCLGAEKSSSLTCTVLIWNTVGRDNFGKQCFPHSAKRLLSFIVSYIFWSRDHSLRCYGGAGHPLPHPSPRDLIGW
jgi:hypothetical protein